MENLLYFSTFVYKQNQRKMSRTAFIIGDSGAGKSHSIQFLNPEETVIINPNTKDLPWKGSGKAYKKFNKDTKEGNVFNVNKPLHVLNVLDYVNKEMPHIKNIIIDDHTHIYTIGVYRQGIKEEETAKHNRQPVNIYQKFTDIATGTIDIANKSKELRDDLTVFIMHHVDYEGDGIIESKRVKAASFGKFVEEKVKGVESLFTIVLLADKRYDENENIEGFFITKSADASIKTPSGMFDTKEIPNNLQIVKDAMTCYYDEENC